MCLVQLRREEAEVRRLLDSKMSEYTRPHVKELLSLIQREIQREEAKVRSEGQVA
jgi:hypothetical protein